jgi:alpha-beta hydrolase superfamily lysophospholipase
MNDAATRRRRRIAQVGALVFAAALAVGAAAGCSTLDTYQRQAIFNPARESPRWFAEPLAGTEEYFLEVAGGERVHVWYVPHADPAAPTVLYLHGARWNMNGSVFRIARWRDLGFNVLAVDYRGFGQSTAILPSEDSARADVQVAWAELVRREPEAAKRYLYGHSLGGALAIDLAAGLPADALAGVIVESTFTSIPDLVRTTRWVTQRFDSAARVGTVQAPLLILHGTADNVVPHAMADALYARAGTPRKQVVKIEGGSHSGFGRGLGVYRDALAAFAPAAGAAASTAAAAALGD